MAEEGPSLNDNLRAAKDAAKIASGDPITIAKYAPKIASCGCLLFIFLLSFFLFFFFWSGTPGTPDEAGAVTPIGSIGSLSSAVPPNYATLFKEAAAAFKVSPGIIAGIYLTEHHSDGFGKDLDSLSAKMTGDCDTSSAGAKGPSQIMPSEWSMFVGRGAAGIKDPDICRYRDSFFASAMVIKAKLTEQPDTRRNCKIDEAGLAGWTAECIKSVGRAYCGACTGPACGTRGYNYCEQTLRHYNIVTGSTAYLPSLLINDKELTCNIKS